MAGPTRRSVGWGCVAILWLGVVPLAHAAPIAFESFETYAAGADLNGNNNGVGWTAPWTADAGHVTVQLKTLQVGGQTRAVRIQPTAAIGNDDSILSRAFPDTPGTLYLSLLLRVESFENDDFVQLQVSDGAVGDNSATLSFGVRNQTGNPFFARVGTSANTTNAAVGAADDTDYFLVAKFSRDGSVTFNRVDLFLNPTSPVEADHTPIAIRSTPSTGLNELSLFNVRVNSLEADDRIFLDNLRIGTTFADVVPAQSEVPEPGTLALWGLGLAAAVGWARCASRRSRRSARTCIPRFTC